MTGYIPKLVDNVEQETRIALNSLVAARAILNHLHMEGVARQQQWLVMQASCSGESNREFLAPQSIYTAWSYLVSCQ